MKNITSDHNQAMEAIVNDYQEQLALCLTDIKRVISLLDKPMAVTTEQHKLSEKIALANEIITQTTQRLENLEKHSHLLKNKGNLTELENYGEIRALLSYQLEKMRQQTEQWQYSA